MEKPFPLAPAAPLARLTSVVVLVCRSRTKTPGARSPSPGSRFAELDRKATKRPSAEIEGLMETLFPLAPAAPVARLTRMVVFVCRSRTYMSPLRSLPSLGSKFDAEDANATNRASAEIAGWFDSALALAPAAPLARLTSVVVFVCRSRTNTSSVASPSAGSRLDADESKARKRPSEEMEGSKESAFPSAPATPVARLTRSRSSFAGQATAASVASASATQQASMPARASIRQPHARRGGGNDR